MHGHMNVKRYSFLAAMNKAYSDVTAGSHVFALHVTASQKTLVFHG